MNRSDVTAKDLIRIFSYNSDNGDLVRNVASKSNARFQGVVSGRNYEGYIVARAFGVKFMAHRIAWACHYGWLPRCHIDHVNGIKDDNRISNLRLADDSVNSKNQSIYKNNKTGIMGVNWHSRDKRYNARICVEGKRVSLGYFLDFFEACCARKSAERGFEFHENHNRMKV